MSIEKVMAVSLWVLLMRPLPVVPLARRSPLHGDGRTVQSFAGVLQPPIHGKTEGRDPIETLYAEMEEEGGSRFAAAVRAREANLQPLPLIDGVLPYLISLPEADWATYRLAPEATEIIYVTTPDLPKFRPTKKDDKIGTTDSYVMFPDHISVLKQLLNV